MKPFKSIQVRILFLLVTFIPFNIFSQIIAFEQVSNHAPAPTQLPIFKPFKEGQSILVDVDGDNDLDVFFSAVSYTGNPNTGSSADSAITELYLNDGVANFTLVSNTPFIGVKDGKIIHADIDNDNDEDIFITGRNNLNQEVAFLYENDGIGNYTKKIGTSFDGVEYGDAEFSDVDNDNDQDLLIVGRNTLGNLIAKLYLNDSLGNFTLSSSNSITGTFYSQVAFADVDGDNDNDLVVSGEVSLFQEETKLYLNNGSGVFSALLNSPFDGISFGDITFEDYDLDGDQDVIIAGYNFANQANAQLYRNNGAGSFTKVVNTPFTDLRSGNLVFNDIDNDNDLDLFLFGTDRSNDPISEFYLNTSSGNFTLDSTYSLIPLANGHISIGDLNSDSLDDIITFGLGNGNASNGHRTYYYLNNGNGFIDLVSGSPFNTSTIFGSKNSTIVSADLEGDGDNDLILYGAYNSKAFDEIYLNNGQGIYNLDTGQHWLISADKISVADVDNDSDQDILVIGKQFVASGTRLYSNNGQNNFSLTPTPTINLVADYSTFADLDNDNDQDLILLRDIGSSFATTDLFLNNGSGSLTQVNPSPFGEYNSGSVNFNDVDNDGDLDVLFIGGSGFNFNRAELFINGGSANFTLLDTISILPAGRNVISKFIDFDNDQDDDIIFFQTSYNSATLEFQANDGNGNFSLVSTPISLAGLKISLIEVDDVDKDGDDDLYVSGKDAFNQPFTRLYLQDSISGFSTFMSFGFSHLFLENGSFELVDIDNDGDKDIALSGSNLTNEQFNRLYRNITCFDSHDTIKVNSCYSYTWLLNDSIYFNSGFYSDTTITRVGCDSIITMDLTVRQFDEITDTIATCDGFVWDITNSLYTKTGVYTDTIKNTNACDTLFILDLTIHSKEYDTSIQSSCNEFLWNATNLIYTQSGLYTDTLTNLNGCDSIISLNLTILNSSYDTIQVTACESYFWSNTSFTYNQTGVYNDTMVNAVGCDSIISLKVIINPVSRDTLTQVACDSFLWAQNGIVYSNTGIYSDTLSSSLNCDSILTLDLTINFTHWDSITVVACDDYVWGANNSLLMSSGRYVDTLISQSGCDSVVILNLTVHRSTLDTITVRSCGAYLWSRNGQSYSSSGFYFDTIPTINNCDSIQVLDLTINSILKDTIEVTACDSFIWRNNTYFSSGFYNDTLLAQTLCDSISTLNLNFTFNDKTVTIVGDSLYANNSVANSYQWMFCSSNGTFIPINGKTNQGFKADSSASYAVEVSQGNCTDTSNCTNVIIVGINNSEHSAFSDWKVYPNPTTSQFFIEVDKLNLGSEIRIFDLSGKLIGKLELDRRKTVIDIPLAAGVYFIQMGEEFKKLIVSTN